MAAVPWAATDLHQRRTVPDEDRLHVWRGLPERRERAEEFASRGKLGARPARGVFGGT
jgi:hypothetical protein